MSSDSPEILPPSQPGLVRVWRWDVPMKTFKTIRFLSVSGLLVLAGWLLQNFLQLRGVVNVFLSRVDLFFLAVCVLTIGYLLTIEARRKRLWRLLLFIGLLICAFGIDRWAPKPQAENPPIPPPARESRHKSMVLRVTHVNTIRAEVNEPLEFRIPVKNTGELDIDAPAYSYGILLLDNSLSGVGEQHLFQYATAGTTPRVLNPGFTIFAGQEVSFLTPPNARQLTTDEARKLKDGKGKYVYILVVLQYGLPQTEAFDDGLLRPHSVYCGYFEKLPEGDFHFCQGFNYVRPKE